MAVVADDFSAMAVSSVVQGDHDRIGPLVFSLDREITLNGRDKWLVLDIDMETPDGAEAELKQFLEKHPEAEKVLYENKPTVQVAGESETSVSDKTLKKIVVSLREQESLLKNSLVLHYTITRKPAESAMRKYKGVVGAEIDKSFEVHDVEAIFSGRKMWEQQKRFGVDGKPTLMESFSWNGTNGKRLIISERTGVKKGWNNYNLSSRSNNPTCTQNILLILGLLGTQEQSLSDFIANHVEEIEISQKGPEILLKFSVLEDKLDYSVVLDSNHGFWPKQITQIFRNANESGVDLGDLKYEYRNIEFGKTNVKGVDVFYPQKMRYISYAGSKYFGKEKSGTPGEFYPIVIDEISVQSIRFEQEIQDDQFQLTFPEGTIIQ